MGFGLWNIWLGPAGFDPHVLMAKDGDCGGALVAVENVKAMENGSYAPPGKKAVHLEDEPPMFRHEDQVSTAATQPSDRITCMCV